MSQPTVTCTVCGSQEVVVPDGRGFPPKIARNRLARRCKEAGHEAVTVYRAGIDPALEELLARLRSKEVGDVSAGEAGILPPATDQRSKQGATMYDWQYRGAIGVNRTPDSRLPEAIKKALAAIGEEETGHHEWHDVTPEGVASDKIDDALAELRVLVQGRRVTTKVLGNRICVRRWNGGKPPSAPAKAA